MNIKEFLRKCQFPLIIAFALYPVVQITMIIEGNEMWPYAWILPISYIALTMAGLWVPSKWRLCYGFLGLAALLAIGGTMFWLTGHYVPIAIGLMFGVILLLGLGFAGMSWGDEIPKFCYWAGISIHVVAQWVLFYAWCNGSTIFEPAATEMQISFLVFIFFALLSMNRSGLVEASMKRQKASASMQIKNIIMVVGFFGIVLLISVSPALISGIRTLYAWLMNLLAALKKESDATEPSATETEPTMGDLSDDPGEIPPVSEVNLWLEELVKTIGNILAVIAIPVAIVLLGVVAFILIRRFVRFLKKLINRYMSFVTEDYQDEVTSIREDGERKIDVFRKIRNRINTVDERKLSPGERIRYRYKRLIQKNPGWGGSHTAREKLPEEMAPFYEKARYSDKAITEEDAQQFTEGIKKL